MRLGPANLRNHTTPFILFLIIFAFYLKSSCSSVYLDDSGETISVAVLLGIGHPPGYPFHTLLASLFSRLPLGSTAIRLNLFAAFLQSLSAILIYVLTLNLARQSGSKNAHAILGAIVAASLFTLGPTTWHNALVAKGSIYGLNNILTLACLLTLIQTLYKEAHERLFWLFLGLALAHHYMSQLVMLPAYAVLLWRRSQPSRLRRLGNSSFVFLGLSIYSYLTIRSSAGCALDWGRIRNFSDFWFFFFRMQYAASELSRSLHTVLRQFLEALNYLVKESSVVGSVLALFAFYASGTSKKITLALGLGTLVPVLAVAFYLNLSIDRLPIMRPYLFPAYISSVCLAGVGLSMAWARWNASRKISLLLTTLILSPLPGAVKKYTRMDLSNYYAAIDFSKATLLHAPRNSALFVNGDALVFPLWYLQRVKLVRRDVAIIGVAVLPMRWVRDDLRRQAPWLRQPRVFEPVGSESVGAIVQGFIDSNPKVQTYFTYDVLEPGIHDIQLINDGMLWKSSRSKTKPLPATALQLHSKMLATVLRPTLDEATLDLLGRDFAVHHNLVGTMAEEQNNLDLALRQYTIATAAAPRRADFVYNTGNALHRLKRFKEAKLAYEKAVNIDPSYVAAWYNLGVNQFINGDKIGALNAFRKVLLLDPSRSDVQNLLTQNNF